MRNYLRATRHPWACLLFLVPLLFAYELGLLWLGGAQTASMRNGADAWLRWAMEVFGVGQVFAVPALLIVVLLVWSWCRWRDRPDDPVRTWFGMAFESGLFACLLWQFSRNYGPIIDTLGVKLEITVNQARAAKILTFIGAGIYEEVLFRLGLFVLLCGLLRVLLPRSVSLVLAGAAAALAFAAAHHVGPYGEPMRADFFVFRTIAGLYFTALFVARGFGVAVGAHAGYDILVGVELS